VTSAAINVVNSAPTASAVNITDNNGGDALVGDTLTGSYSYSDVDNDLEGTSTFRWLRNGTAIPGATATTYILVAADSGATITFEVTPVAVSGVLTGNAVTSGGITVTNSAPLATAVSITDNNGGDALVGDSLSGSYSYSDIDNDTEGASTYRWLRDGAAIPGATAQNYTLVTADSGASISFEVTPVAVSGTTPGAAVSSSTITVANSAPTATSVGISDDNGGVALVGDSLTGNYTFNDVDGDAEGSSTYAWLRNGSPIATATTTSYTLVAADSGTVITFEVTPVAAGGTTTGTTVTSAGITIANSAPTATAVNITDDNGNDPLVGDSLTGNYTYSDADNDTEGTSTFRWLRNNAPIAGATSTTYTLVAADSGATITFEVTPVALTGEITGNAVTSSGLTVVNSAPIATAVVITDDDGGAALIGDSLTGSYNYSDADGDAEGATTVRWLRNGTAISGATASTYTLVSADAGQTITFEVTPVAATGNQTGTAVVSSGVTVSTNVAPTASAVSISDDNGGNIVVGVTLTGNYTYSDIDTDAEGTSTYRWLRDNVAIPGATAQSYTLVAIDSGTTITFEVTPVAATGVATGTPVVSAGVTVNNSAPTATAVSISDDNGGNIVVGVTLTGNYTYSDIDTDAEGTSTFRWLRDDVAIPGATAQSYTLVADDADTTITFEVTPVAATGAATGTPVVSAGVTVNNSAPTASAVSISDDNGGNILAGVTLTGNYTYSDIDNDLEGTSTYRWLRDNVAIPGATAQSYTLVADDAGTTITFEVIPVAATGVSTGTPVVSTGITVSTNVAPMASAVTISDNNSGNIVVGVTLTGNYTYNDADGDLEGTTTFQWLRNSVAISGATSSTYTVDAADSGTTVTFEVTPVAATGVASGSAVVSSGVFVVNSAPTAIDVSITDDNLGNAVIGDSLTGGYTFDDIDGDAEGASTFRWLRNDAPIAGATSSTYTLTSADVPAKIKFEVTPVAATGVLTGTATVSAVLPTGTAPVVSGFARYLDSNLDGSYSASDELIVPFDQVVNTSTVASSDFDLPVNGDGFGSGATVIQGPANNEVTIILGNNPKFTLDGEFAAGTTSPNSPSGIDVDAAITADAIESLSGIDAVPSQVIDLIPAFVDSGQALGTENSQSIALADIDGDTDLDMIVANASGQGNRVYTNNGSGTFTDSGQTLGSSDSQSIAVGDVDGINGLDIVVANASTQANLVYLNDGSGNFSDSGQALGTGNSQSIVLGDVDGDADLDIVVANAGAQANRIYLNDGNGIFSDSGQALGTNDSQSIVLANVDGVIGLDIIVANASGQGNRVYTNNGTGTFTDSGQSLGSGNSQSIAVGDVDGINGLDIVVANAGAQANQVYINDGNGNFSAGAAFGANDSQSIVLTDVDGDVGGAPDIIVANASGEGNRVYLNDGSGSFTDSGQSLGTNVSQSVAVGDVDGDGDEDMAIANSGQANRVYMSSQSGP
jgi:hypothetical protein